MYGLFIKVLWLGAPDKETTWEPASSLPLRLIEQFESNIVAEVTTEKEECYGNVSNVITIKKKEELQQSSTKRAHIERLVPGNIQGYVVHFH